MIRMTSCGEMLCMLFFSADDIFSGWPSLPVLFSFIQILNSFFNTSNEHTGKGRAFSAGFDLKSAAGLAPKEDTTPDLTTGILLEG